MAFLRKLLFLYDTPSRVVGVSFLMLVVVTYETGDDR